MVRLLCYRNASRRLNHYHLISQFSRDVDVVRNFQQRMKAHTLRGTSRSPPVLPGRRILNEARELYSSTMWWRRRELLDLYLRRACHPHRSSLQSKSAMASAVVSKIATTLGIRFLQVHCEQIRSKELPRKAVSLKRLLCQDVATRIMQSSLTPK